MPRPRLTRAPGGVAAAPSFVAYYRVSTAKQGISGLGLDAQRAAVASLVAARTGVLAGEYEEVESGKLSDRPQLAAALAACRARSATLIIAKLDRLARNTAFLLSVVEGCGEAGVVFCDLPQVPPGPMGKFFVTLMAAVAELEAGMISARTKAALAAAKARGVKLGSRRIFSGFDGAVARKGREVQVIRSATRAAAVLPYITAARSAGCTTLQEVADALTARGVRPPMGGEVWHPAQVRRVLVRAGLVGDPVSCTAPCAPSAARPVLSTVTT